MATYEEAVAVLREEVKDPKYDGLTSRQVQRLLVARPPVPNPAKQENVPKPLDRDTVVALAPDTIGDEMQAALYAAIQANDPGALKTFSAIVCKTDAMGKSALDAEADATIPDPTYKATLPGATRLEELGIADIEWPDEAVTHCGFNGAYDIIAEARK